MREPQGPSWLNLTVDEESRRRIQFVCNLTYNLVPKSWEGFWIWTDALPCSSSSSRLLSEGGGWWVVLFRRPLWVFIAALKGKVLLWVPRWTQSCHCCHSTSWFKCHRLFHLVMRTVSLPSGWVKYQSIPWKQHHVQQLHRSLWLLACKDVIQWTENVHLKVQEIILWHFGKHVGALTHDQ